MNLELNCWEPYGSSFAGATYAGGSTGMLRLRSQTTPRGTHSLGCRPMAALKASQLCALWLNYLGISWEA